MAYDQFKSGLGKLNKPAPWAKVPSSAVDNHPIEPGRIRGRVTLWDSVTGLTITGQHHKPAQVTQEAVGTWRPVGTTFGNADSIWRPENVPPMKVTLYLLFDGYTQHPKRPVTKELESLRALAFKQGNGRWPRLRVIGATPCPDHTYWRLNGLTVDERLHTSSGAPCQAWCEVELIEARDANITIRRASVAKRVIYTWRPRDTLTKVCRRFYGDYETEVGRAKALVRNANPTINFTKIKPGTKVDLPATTVTETQSLGSGLGKFTGRL